MAHAVTPVAAPTAIAGTGSTAAASPAALPQPMPVIQCTTLFTGLTKESSRSIPTSSATRLPTRAGAGAASPKSVASVESSQVAKSFSPPPAW